MYKKSSSKSIHALPFIAGLAAGYSSLIILLLTKKSIGRSSSVTTHLSEDRSKTDKPIFQDTGHELSAAGIPTRFIADPSINTTADGQTITRSAEFSSTTKYLVGVGLFLFFLYVIYLGRNVIPLIILGSLISFLVQPVINFFQTRLHFRHGIAIIITYILALLFILLIPLILIPSVISTANLISGIDYQAEFTRLAGNLINFGKQLNLIPYIGPIIGGLFNPIIDLLNNIATGQSAETFNFDIAMSELVSRIASTLGVLVRAVGALASAMVAVFFSFFISVYLSFDGHKMNLAMSHLLPPLYKDEIKDLLRSLGTIWRSFLRGQITLMVIIGGLIWLGALILGLPQPIFFGFLSGTLEMIPSLGPLLAFIPAVAVAFLFGSTHLQISNLIFGFIIAGFYLLVQFVENQFIVPRVLGKAVDLHPLVVLIGALAAGSQFGILGIFLAAPVMASVKVICKYLYNKILETHQPPEPSPKQTIITDLKAFITRIGSTIFNPFQRSTR